MTNLGPDLKSYEDLSDKQEKLLRQIHPDQFTVDGQPASSAFLPRASHAGLLSTRRQHIGAERAFREWIENHESRGTWGVTVGEVENASLRAFDDSNESDHPEGHASVDFNSLTTNGLQKRSARVLRDHAVKHGCLHPTS